MVLKKGTLLTCFAQSYLVINIGTVWLCEIWEIRELCALQMKPKIIFGQEIRGNGNEGRIDRQFF